MNESYECLRSSVPLVSTPPVVKVPILQHLEGLRDEELEERREKRRRQLAEEEEAKQNERSTSAGEESREQSLQVRGEREREGGREKGWSGLGQQRARRGCFERGKRE